MKTAILHFLLGFVTLIGSSCEPQELQEPQDPKTLLMAYEVPPQLIGEYTLHTGERKTGKEEILITITSDHVTVKDLYDLNLADYTIFVNGDCWMVVHLNPTVELRFSDYIKEQSFIVVTLWVNGKQVDELGVYDKVIRTEQ